jgi:hypothetical protein
MDYIPPAYRPSLSERELFMARIVMLDGDECLWNVVQDILEGEGYTVIAACNDYEGVSPDEARLMMALQTQDTRYLIAY